MNTPHDPVATLVTLSFRRGLLAGLTLGCGLAALGGLGVVALMLARLTGS